jgi:putative ABC transport system permease protein
MLNKLRLRLRALFFKSKMEDELQAELQFHLEREIEENIIRGMTPEEARCAAIRSFGGVERVKEESRDVRGIRLLEEVRQDLRFGARMLLKQPGFALIAALTLALGIGANTAIFSVVNALLLRPLPYPEPDRLMAVVFDNDQPQGFQFWPYPKFAALQHQQTSLASLAAYRQVRLTVTVGEQPEKAEVEIVTAGYFPLLGVRAAQGRVFLPEEDQTPDAHLVVLLGHRFWQRQFGGDPQVLGKTVYIKNHPFVVVGVLPPDFRGQSGTVELWAPMMTAGKLMYADALNAGYAWWLKVIAQLKPGVTEAQARAELPIVSAKVAQLAPARMKNMLSQSGEELIRLIPLKETKVDPAIRRSFLLLLAAVGLVLLIACANTANLLLGRAVTRQKEFAVRLALGAGRARIVRQVLTESLLLAVIGGAAGLLVALWGVDWLTTAKPWNTVGFWSQYARTFDYFAVKLDWPALAFNFLLAFITGVIFGLAPAFQASRSQLNEALKEGAGGSVSGFRSLRRPSARAALVVTEIVLSLVLLAGAGLMIKSFARLSAVKLGFDPKGVVTLAFGADQRPAGFYRALLERMQTLAGIEGVSLALTTPLSGSQIGGGVQIEGGAPVETERVRATYNVVTPDYFKTFRIAVLKGRNFTAEDRIGALRVALVSRTLAERAWPGGESLGKRFKTPFRDAYGEVNAWIEIVGVVDDVKYGAVEDSPEPVVYLPAWQPLGTPQALSLTPDTLSIRTSVDPASLIAAVRREAQSLDKGMPLYDISAMTERATRATSRYRYSALLMGLFAGLALALAAVGIYGVMAYSVSARTREIGVRVALGAQAGDILCLIIVDGVALIGAGTLLGLLAAFVSTRVLKSQLYGVDATDPLTFLAVSLALAAVALSACYIPARRAMKIDPMIALRSE